MDRFQRERMMLPRVPDNWAAMAFASTLNEKSSESMRRLKESFREFPATTWNDVYNRYNTKLRTEEDTVAQPRVDKRAKSRQSESEKRTRKTGSSSRFRKERDARGIDSNTHARVGDYSFNVSTSELVAILRGVGDKGEGEHLLKQGYLTDMFNEKGRQSYMKNKQEPPKPPSLKRPVNVITKGDEVNGVTYTAAKKTSKVTVTHRKRVRQVLDGDSITFDDEDVDGLMIPHNDALVTSLLVHDTNVKRVLIDPGSSMNIILLRAMNEIQANDKVIPKAWSLSGLYNSSAITKGKLVLATFAKGVIKDTKFHVIDADMAYYIILGGL
ncbi:uncharacterized protein [Nicotiana sylvestris]|uniref:Uncharacterized protein n=2 Tax=Nicotiana TaxID=4085 RepID=A0A1S4CKB2_TOBAC|nr:PREDICTED: uncharacterized protein LOC104227635 [Nicotiana sylvestris]XP_016501672.1 PREDICTED: uncharacterized protein LOC107819988 [Nicotiana tabacum]